VKFILTCYTEDWLNTLSEANPKMSYYLFCINPKYPGYFFLIFKAGRNAKLSNWPVKVIPGAFELQKVRYQDMKSLCNGFKTIFGNMAKRR
jgi:transcription elongation factor SPT6